MGPLEEGVHCAGQADHAVVDADLDHVVSDVGVTDQGVANPTRDLGVQRRLRTNPEPVLDAHNAEHVPRGVVGGSHGLEASDPAAEGRDAVRNADLDLERETARVVEERVLDGLGDLGIRLDHVGRIAEVGVLGPVLELQALDDDRVHARDVGREVRPALLG